MGQNIDQKKFNDIKDLSIKEFTEGYSIDESQNEYSGRRFRVCFQQRQTDRIIFMDIVDQIKHIAKLEKANINNLKLITSSLDCLIKIEAESQEKCEARMKKEFLYKILTILSRLFQRETAAEALANLKTKIDTRISKK